MGAHVPLALARQGEEPFGEAEGEEPNKRAARQSGRRVCRGPDIGRCWIQKGGCELAELGIRVGVGKYHFGELGDRVAGDRVRMDVGGDEEQPPAVHESQLKFDHAVQGFDQPARVGCSWPRDRSTGVDVHDMEGTSAFEFPVRVAVSFGYLLEAPCEGMGVGGDIPSVDQGFLTQLCAGDGRVSLVAGLKSSACKAAAQAVAQAGEQADIQIVDSGKRQIADFGPVTGLFRQRGPASLMFDQAPGIAEPLLFADQLLSHPMPRRKLV